MKHFLRPYFNLGVAALLGASIMLAPPRAASQASRISQIVDEPSYLLLHSGSQGYLGVLVGDVDNDSAPKFKLKEVRGAVITLIDHDAPAAAAGLHVNDVVLEVNGQAVEGAEQFGRMMREIPPGRKVTLGISRDGVQQSITVQLVDHKVMERDVWNKLDSGSDIFSPAPGLAILPGTSGGAAPASGGFHLPFFGPSLNVGALVEPLTSQMADYLGVPSGLMVKQVVHKSEAAAAGLKAFDVILKVGNESIATVSDWDRSLRSNQGKTVQVTILRDKKQQTVSLQVDSKHKGELEFEMIFPDSDCPLMAALDGDAAEILAKRFDGDASAIQSMRDQAEALKDQFGTMHFEITPEQAEGFRKQAEALRDSFKDQNFQFDPKELDQLRQQMQQMKEFSKQFKDFKPEDFKLDQKQMDELKQQMEQFRKNFKPEDFKFDQKELDQLKEQLKQQMDEVQVRGFGVYV
jgi:serine protease Do